jgi:hypothetical protein
MFMYVHSSSSSSSSSALVLAAISISLLTCYIIYIWRAPDFYCDRLQRPQSLGLPPPYFSLVAV